MRNFFSTQPVIGGAHGSNIPLCEDATGACPVVRFKGQPIDARGSSVLANDGKSLAIEGFPATNSALIYSYQSDS